MVRLIILVSFICTIYAGSNSHQSNLESANWLTDWLIPHPGLYLWTLITFFLVLFILKWKAWGPLMDALEDREKRINDALSSADKARQEAEKVSGEYDEMIKKAQTEAQKIVSKGKKAGEKLKQEIENKAKIKSDELMAKTNKEIESAKSKALDEIKSTSVDLAIQAASKIISKNLDDSTNRDLAKNTINDGSK